MRSQFLSIVILGAGLLSGCAATSSNTAPASPAAAAASALKAPGEAKVGDKSTCPASGDEFVVSESSPKTEYEGKTYYFCCPGCSKKFESDPKKFLANPPAHHEEEHKGT